MPEEYQTWGVGDMKFPGYQRNSMWNFQGLKNEVECGQGDQEKIMWNCHC